MSALNRDAIYDALLAFFQAITAADGSQVFRSAFEDPRTWETCPPEDQPAICLSTPIERSEQTRRGIPRIWTLRPDLLIYVNTQASLQADSAEPSQAPSAMRLLNPILDAVEAALAVDDFGAGAVTLGGLVSSVSLDGDLLRFPGTLGNEATALVPLSIIVSPGI